MSLLDRVRVCAQWDPSHYRPFRVCGRLMGHVGKDLAANYLLTDFAKVPVPGHADPVQVFVRPDGRPDMVELSDQLRTPETRTKAVAEVVRKLVQARQLPELSGYLAPLVRYWGESALLEIDRAAMPSFGGRTFGLSINLVEPRTAGTFLWLAERDKSLEESPGKLDAGVDAPLMPGDTLRGTLYKAADQSASLSAQAVGNFVKPASLVSYIFALPDGGLCNQAWFCFDYEPVRPYTPRNKNGEVATFKAISVENVIEILRETQDFKHAAALVVIDFLIRRGYVNAANQPQFQQIIQGLRLGDEEEKAYWQNDVRVGARLPAPGTAPVAPDGTDVSRPS